MPEKSFHGNYCSALCCGYQPGCRSSKIDHPTPLVSDCFICLAKLFRRGSPDESCSFHYGLPLVAGELAVQHFLKFIDLEPATAEAGRW